MSKTTFQKAIDQRLAKKGLRMAKCINQGGFFSSPTYDRRRVYNRTDIDRLNAEGFSVDEDIGLWIFNALFVYDPKENTNNED